MRAKKSYGQHFLNNEYMAEKIAEGLELTHLYQKVLEVGPGKGMLTKYLVKRDFELTVVEADRDMVAYQEEHFPSLKGRIISSDFLKINIKEHFGEENFALIGNYPYNISSQIVFTMLENRAQIPEMVGMFQKEVADRIIAKHGSKTYGVVSVLVQAYYEGYYMFTVKPGNFNPPPKVQSAVIRLVRKENQDLGCSYKLFRRVVKQAFSQRRKMLRNTMKIFIKDPVLLKDDFFNTRPEQVDVEKFVWLTNWIQKHGEF